MPFLNNSDRVGKRLTQKTIFLWLPAGYSFYLLLGLSVEMSLLCVTLLSAIQLVFLREGGRRRILEGCDG